MMKKAQENPNIRNKELHIFLLKERKTNKSNVSTLKIEE